jgi:hypothetical protein
LNSVGNDELVKPNLQGVRLQAVRAPKRAGTWIVNWTAREADATQRTRYPGWCMGNLRSLSGAEVASGIRPSM